MPYKLVKKTGKRPFKMIKKSTGKVVGSSVDESMARKAIIARAMHEEK